MRKLSIGVGVLALATASAIVLGAGPAGVGPDVPPGGPTPDPRGLLWNSSGVFQRSYDVMTTSVNSSGDVALVPGIDSQAEIVRANGADVKLGSGSSLAYLVDRGHKVSGAGFVGYPASETNRAATWSGC